jgi:pullulanase
VVSFLNFDCPECGQNLEIDDSWAGQEINCPKCERSISVPMIGASADESASALATASSPDGEQSSHEVRGSGEGDEEAGSAASPPMHVPLQPLSPEERLFKKRRKKHISALTELVLIVIFAALAGFVYDSFRRHESPQQAWTRLADSTRAFIKQRTGGAPPPEATPEASPEVAASAPARPDPVMWLQQHKEAWPNEIVLREAFEFPAVSGGKTFGSLKSPPGSTVKIKDIGGGTVTVDYLGGTRQVPIEATDLAARADLALSKFEREAKSERPAKPATAAPAPVEGEEEIQQATREEAQTAFGALYTQGQTTFRVFAPAAKSISVALYQNATGDEGRVIRPLRQESNGIWDENVRGNLRGKYYTFLLDANDPKRAREVLDPYAVNAVASSSRGRITPLAKALAHGPMLESPTDAIIYEMHVRDFTVAPSSGAADAGLYMGWTHDGTTLPQEPDIKTTLDHLVELGVTHVELMPVQDFENDEASASYNWGYITDDFFSPEGMFASNPNDNSRVHELRALIKALHERGLCVIMDVVYNHTGGKAPLFALAPDQYYRRMPDGSTANGSGCGNEFRSESPNGRRLILDSLKFWTREYGIDGFRFDLMALIDQETMRQADRELRKLHPGMILFGEPWTGGNSPLRDKSDKSAIRQIPPGAFNDDLRNALKGAPDGGEPGWIQNGSNRDALKAALLIDNWFASPGQSINYMTCHDNLVLWDKLVKSMPEANDALRIDTMKLGYLALLTSQGVPFMHGGEEFARTKGGNNNSYDSPDSVNEVDWTLKRDHIELYKYVRDAIALRKAHPMFRLRTRSQVQSRLHFVENGNRDVLMYTLDGEGVPGESWKRVCIALNSSNTNDAVVIPPGNSWNVAMDGEGAVAEPRIVSGKVTLPRKSGAVLFQR